jgi:hypothetical protein
MFYILSGTSRLSLESGWQRSMCLQRLLQHILPSAGDLQLYVTSMLEFQDLQYYVLVNDLFGIK